MSSEHAGVVRDSVASLAAEIMEAEVAAQVGPEFGEISLREAQINGVSSRTVDRLVEQLGIASMSREGKIAKVRNRSLHVYVGERALDLPQTLAEQAAAIISKGLANLLGHARGSAGTVRSCDAGDALLFEGCDDGATGPTEPRFGSGLVGVSVRALTIDASPGSSRERRAVSA